MLKRKPEEASCIDVIYLMSLQNMVLPFEYETYITCCLACSGGGGAGKRLGAGASEKRLQHVTCVTCVNVPKVHQLIRVLAFDKA